MRAFCIIVAVGIVSIVSEIEASVIDISAAERGFVMTCSNCIPIESNNGASPSNNFFAGWEFSPPIPPLGSGPEVIARNWFEFAIPVLAGQSPVSATLNLDETLFGHIGGSLTFSVYGLTGRPLLFTDVVTGNPFGGTNTSGANDNTTIKISLNSAALAAIITAQGGSVFIGGIDSGENNAPNPPSGSDFGASQSTNSVLELTTTPEPATSALLGAGIVALAGFRRRLRPAFPEPLRRRTSGK